MYLRCCCSLQPFLLFASPVGDFLKVGTGCGLEIGKRLADGDSFELEIENIGILANRIVKAW